MPTPPFKITAKVVNLISEISALLERHTLLNDAAQVLRLRRANRIKTIHSSLAIEGNTLSEEEVHDIMDGRHIVAPLRQIQEVRNAIKVYDEYSSFNPFREKDLLRAHSIMMQSLVDRPGSYRSGGVGVYSETGLVHMAPPPAMVPRLMSDLFQWLATADDHLLIRSCVFHYEFEFIHPFADGNGRIGRLWQSIILGRINPLFEHLPVENMVYSNQARYYDAIAASTSAGESSPFIEFMLEEIRLALKAHMKDEVTDKVADKVDNKVANKSELALLRLLDQRPQITIKQMSELSGLSVGGVKKIISSLKANGWVQRSGSNKNGRWIVKIDIREL